MKTTDARPGKGTLPLAAGLSPEQIADMTPEHLRELADLTVGQSKIFLGS